MWYWANGTRLGEVFRTRFTYLGSVVGVRYAIGFVLRSGQCYTVNVFGDLFGLQLGLLQGSTRRPVHRVRVDVQLFTRSSFGTQGVLTTRVNSSTFWSIIPTYQTLTPCSSFARVGQGVVKGRGGVLQQSFVRLYHLTSYLTQVVRGNLQLRRGTFFTLCFHVTNRHVRFGTLCFLVLLRYGRVSYGGTNIITNRFVLYAQVTRPHCCVVVYTTFFTRGRGVSSPFQFVVYHETSFGRSPRNFDDQGRTRHVFDTTSTYCSRQLGETCHHSAPLGAGVGLFLYFGGLKRVTLFVNFLGIVRVFVLGVLYSVFVAIGRFVYLSFPGLYILGNFVGRVVYKFQVLRLY